MSKDNSLQVDDDVANTSSDKLRRVKSRGGRSQGAVVFLIHFCIKALCRAFNSAALLFDNYRQQLPKLFISFRPGTPFTQRNANFWNVTSYFYLLHSNCYIC